MIEGSPWGVKKRPGRYGNPTAAQGKIVAGQAQSIMTLLLRREEESRSSGLLGVDDAAADGAGAGEEVLELVALTPADGALQGG